MTRRRRSPSAALVVPVAIVALVATGCLDAPPPLEPELAGPTSLPVVDVAPSAVDATPPPTEGTSAAPPPSAEELTVRRRSAGRAARELTLRVRTSGCGELLTGSGFAIDDDVLVTNRHVVEGGTRVQVNTWDGRSATAAFVSAAFQQDLAIVRLDADLPRSAELSPTDPAPGDEVTVVGYPEGGEQELVAGTVIDYVIAVSQGREIESVRLTAPASPGSSGGPVIDADGRVAAVVYALEVETGHTLAIPASALRRLLDGGGDVGAPVRC